MMDVVRSGSPAVSTPPVPLAVRPTSGPTNGGSDPCSVLGVGAGMIAWLRLFGFVVAVLGALALPRGDAAAAKYAAIVVDAGTGEVLYARNADRQRYPASLAKMMTIYLTFAALEAGELALDQTLTISKYAARQPASRLGLRPGQTITVEDAILALVTKSANDVAAALAETLGGTERKFAFGMTRAARRLGMKHTRFTNASGLPNRRQRSTARDLSILARALIHVFPKYYHYFAVESFTYGGRTYKGHNRLLRSVPGADGLKTGYISASGFQRRHFGETRPDPPGRGRDGGQVGAKSR